MSKKMSLVLMAVLTSSVAWAGGATVGSGGDGLLMSSAMLTRDVVVPVPPSLTNYGTLQVMGEAGSGQTDAVRLSKCAVDTHGQPLRFGCVSSHLLATLNRPFSLAAGFYEVWYSNSRYPKVIEIKKNQTLVLRLSKIQVPKLPGQYEFKFFSDLTDRSEQDGRLLSFYGAEQNRSVLDICVSKESADVSANVPATCRALGEGDFHAWLDTYVRFTVDASVERLNIMWWRWENLGRNWVNDPKDGDFVSVFPGVYGVEFKDTQSGQIETQYGIRVEE